MMLKLSKFSVNKLPTHLAILVTYACILDQIPDNVKLNLLDSKDRWKVEYILPALNRESSRWNQCLLKFVLESITTVNMSVKSTFVRKGLQMSILSV